MPSRRIDFYHAPQSRSFGTLTLLEELKASYQPHVLDLKKNQQREPAYLAINPMGKVPAIVHDGVLVTEQGAIFIYLSDLYSEAGLSPVLGDSARGAWLRWLVFYGSSFEPAIFDRAQKNPAAPPSSSPYGDFETMFATLNQQLESGPYLLGERFTTADVLWGSALKKTTLFGVTPATPVIEAYIARVTSRPSFQRAQEIDAQWLATQSGN